MKGLRDVARGSRPARPRLPIWATVSPPRRTATGHFYMLAWLSVSDMTTS